jgi:tetratricopeptide (TPR) repeat protein
MGAYYLSAVTFPADPKLLDKARELAPAASDGESRFIEAMAIARGDKPAQAIEPLSKLSRDYPGERIVRVLLGQVLAGEGRLREARREYQAALALDASTPRVPPFSPACWFSRDYPARAACRSSRSCRRGRFPGRSATASPSPISTREPRRRPPLAAHLRGRVPKAGALRHPEVFIWNSIARINLENGRLEEAMKAYEKGYESVPGSGLDEDDKKIWLGRLHHGKGRTLARMGRQEEAWKLAQTLRQMIEAGGEKGKAFEPAYHYLAGYIKLEAGEAQAAVDHLKKADPDDPFQKLLLARHEKAGDKPGRCYQEVWRPRPGPERACTPRRRRAVAMSS